MPARWKLLAVRRLDAPEGLTVCSSHCVVTAASFGEPFDRGTF